MNWRENWACLKAKVLVVGFALFVGDGENQMVHRWVQWGQDRVLPSAEGFTMAAAEI